MSKSFLFFAMPVILFSEVKSFGAKSYYPSNVAMLVHFQECVRSDETWMRRWGRYVISFEENEASQICLQGDEVRGIPRNSRPRATGCSINGNWLYAGFYCQEPNGPSALR